MTWIPAWGKGILLGDLNLSTNGWIDGRMDRQVDGWMDFIATITADNITMAKG